MKFTVDKHEKYVLLKMEESKFTDNNAAGLKSELYLLNAAGYKNIIVDLSAVQSCNDAQDLSSLLVGERLCTKEDGTFVVTGVNQELSHIISISNIFTSVNFVDKVEEATDLIFMEELEREFRGETDK